MTEAMSFYISLAFLLMEFLLNRIYEVTYLTSCLKQMLLWPTHAQTLYLTLGYLINIPTRILLTP